MSRLTWLIAYDMFITANVRIHTHSTMIPAVCITIISAIKSSRHVSVSTTSLYAELQTAKIHLITTVKEEMFSFFWLVGLSVCLSVDKITQKVMDECSNCLWNFWEGSHYDKENRFRFWQWSAFQTCQVTRIKRHAGDTRIFSLNPCAKSIITHWCWNLPQ